MRIASFNINGIKARLPRLLEWLQPDVAWFPAQWPETYSYTLSACLQAGLPVVAPASGGPVDLVDPSRTGWLYTPGDLLGAC